MLLFRGRAHGRSWVLEKALELEDYYLILDTEKHPSYVQLPQDYCWTVLLFSQTRSSSKKPRALFPGTQSQSRYYCNANRLL